ncbi:hypothetical protein ACHAXR_011552 [Thalassiosira sp. AJA248-18]
MLWRPSLALSNKSGEKKKHSQFFIHDPRPGNETSADDKDESKIWFQGRFFPSRGVAEQQHTNNGRSRRHRNSPTSVLSSERFVASSIRGNSSSTTLNSWGLLAVQNAIIDECLTCSEGGYRELDLTFIRQKTTASSTTRMSMKKKKEKKVRWVAQDVVWTGGNMMMLSSDPYSPSSLSNATEPGVKFEPQKLMEGRKAMEVATKYFPSMVKRLRIHKVTNDESLDYDGKDSGSSLEDDDDVMVLIGDMEVVAPVSFVRMRNSAVAFSGGGDSSDDGLWDDE